MRTRMKRAPTAEDLKLLATAHRQLQMLTVGLHPSCAGFLPLYASIATVRACMVEWSGDPNAGLDLDSIKPLAGVSVTARTP